MKYLKSFILELTYVERIGSPDEVYPKIFYNLLRWVNPQAEILEFLAMKRALRTLAQID